MSSVWIEWLIVLLFFLLALGFTFAEAFWLNRRGWTGFGRAFAFAASTNFIGLTVGFFAVFVALLVVIMIVFDGATDKLPAGDYSLAAILIFAALVTPLLLLLCKRVFLGVLKIQTGKSAWLYAAASAALILIITLGIPFLVGYVAYR